MPARIKNRGVVPYNGQWNYRDPHGGRLISSYRYEILISKIKKYRQDNGFPIGLEFEKEVEEQLCVNHPDECSDLPPGLPYKTRLQLSDVVRGSQVMMRFYAAGKPLVSQEEAERRAEICSKCGLNDDYSRPCSIGICGALRDVVQAITSKRGTKFDHSLRVCRICHCFLSASVHLPLEIQCPSVTDEMKEQFKYAKQKSNCWKQCT